MNARILETEQALVLHITDFAPENWVRFVSNIEIDEDRCDSISLFIVEDGPNLIKIDAGDPNHGQTYHGLLTPIREVWEAHSQKWKVADLVIDFDGKYTIRYGQVHRRLAEPMNMDGVTVLQNYITRFADEIPRR